MFVHVSVSIFRRQIIIRCNQTLHSTLHAYNIFSKWAKNKILQSDFNDSKEEKWYDIPNIYKSAHAVTCIVALLIFTDNVRFAGFCTLENRSFYEQLL